MSLRLIFMGTPDFAVQTLLELVAHGHEIAAVYTRVAKPAGRGMKLQPTPVEVEAWHSRADADDLENTRGAGKISRT
jgi:methionyl-tRNA formyltransferase